MGKGFAVLHILWGAGLMLCSSISWGDDFVGNVVIGKQYSLHSTVLQEQRYYKVYLPASYNNPTYSPRHYPVMYVLDGDAHFQTVTAILRLIADSNDGNSRVPEMIVVAIANTNRNRDMLPSHSLLDYKGQQSALLQDSGGGDAFLQFLREELIPDIDSQYRTNGYRMLIGHSFAGLLVVHQLLQANSPFQAYIAIDPSLWWNHQEVLKQLKKGVDSQNFSHRMLYIAQANTPAEDGIDPTLMSHSITAVAEQLGQIKNATWQYFLRYFSHENHATVPMVAIYDALSRMYSDYKPKLDDYIDEPGKILTHFRRFDERIGMPYAPRENVINQLGYHLLRDLNNPAKALEAFALNVKLFPNSYNVYDSLAEGYARSGQIALAIQNYQKSLSLNEDNKNARNRLALLSQVPVISKPKAAVTQPPKSDKETQQVSNADDSKTDSVKLKSIGNNSSSDEDKGNLKSISLKNTEKSIDGVDKNKNPVVKPNKSLNKPSKEGSLPNNIPSDGKNDKSSPKSIHSDVTIQKLQPVTKQGDTSKQPTSSADSQSQ